MPSLNKVILMGNLTRKPEPRYTQKGMALTDIGLAINRRYKVGDETREEVVFVDVTFWGKQAETIAQYCSKGDPLYVEARLHVDSWDDKETGRKRSALKLTGEEFQFLKPKGDGGGERGQKSERPARQGAAPQGGAPQGQGAGLDDADEIPF